MATKFYSDDAPPAFNKRKDDYRKWKKLFGIWHSITDVAKAKQGGLLILRLDDDTQDEILDFMTVEDTRKENAVEKILGHLDTIFAEDEAAYAYKCYKNLISYRRPVNVNISDYCRGFQQCLSKVKLSGTHLSDQVLAHMLLRSANLRRRDIQLIMTTSDNMLYGDVLKQLQRVFSQDVTEKIHQCSSNNIHSEQNEWWLKTDEMESDNNEQKCIKKNRINNSYLVDHVADTYSSTSIGSKVKNMVTTSNSAATVCFPVAKSQTSVNLPTIEPISETSFVDCDPIVSTVNIDVLNESFEFKDCVSTVESSVVPSMSSPSDKDTFTDSLVFYESIRNTESSYEPSLSLTVPTTGVTACKFISQVNSSTVAVNGIVFNDSPETVPASDTQPLVLPDCVLPSLLPRIDFISGLQVNESEGMSNISLPGNMFNYVSLENQGSKTKKQKSYSWKRRKQKKKKKVVGYSTSEVNWLAELFILFSVIASWILTKVSLEV